MRLPKAYAKRLLGPVLDRIEFNRLPPAAQQTARADAVGLRGSDPGAEAAIAAALEWIGRAQDCSRNADGGVGRHYSLMTGWGSSYPETTGYIVPTMLDQAARRRDEALRRRAERMLDWLLSIQFPEGGFRGGTID